MSNSGEPLSLEEVMELLKKEAGDKEFKQNLLDLLQKGLIFAYNRNGVLIWDLNYMGMSKEEYLQKLDSSLKEQIKQKKQGDNGVFNAYA